MIMREGAGPALTVDGVLVEDGMILLVERGREPFKGLMALPGGFVDNGETVEAAVMREMREETDLETEAERLLGVYSDPERDPRGHTVSVVFELRHVSGRPVGGDDAAAAGWYPLDELPELAFDHRRIIEECVLRPGD